MLDQLTSYEVPVDEKGRLSIARSWVYRGHNVVIAKSSILNDSRRYLFGCLKDDLNDYLNEHTSFVHDVYLRKKIARRICGNSDICPFDNQGRIRIPRKMLGYIDMGIKTKANVIINEVYKGMKAIEIWNVEDWKTMEKQLV